MIKKFVVSAVLATMLATPVVAKEVVTNGGFEDGLTAWELITAGGYTNAVWETVSDTKTSGEFSGYTPWDYQVRQDLEPVPVKNIKSFKVNAKLAHTTNAVVIVTYVPEEGRSKYSDYIYVILSPEDIEWNEYDVLQQLDPAKTLESVKLSGYSSNSPAGTWFDDVTIETYDPVAAPELVSAVCPNVDQMVQTSYDQGISEGLVMCEPETVIEYVDRPVKVVEYVEVIKEVQVVRDVVETVEVVRTVEVPVEVIKTVFVDQPVHVPAETITVSVCDSDFSSMSKKDQRQISKYCGHVAKWEARIAKLVNTGVDNNSGSSQYVGKSDCDKNGKKKRTRTQERSLAKM